jgi:hypothetical protein
MAESRAAFGGYGLLLLVRVQDIVDSFISKKAQDIVNTF